MSRLSGAASRIAMFSRVYARARRRGPAVCCFHERFQKEPPRRRQNSSSSPRSKRSRASAMRVSPGGPAHSPSLREAAVASSSAQAKLCRSRGVPFSIAATTPSSRCVVEIVSRSKSTSCGSPGPWQALVETPTGPREPASAGAPGAEPFRGFEPGFSLAGVLAGTSHPVRLVHFARLGRLLEKALDVDELVGGRRSAIGWPQRRGKPTRWITALSQPSFPIRVVGPFEGCLAGFKAS